MIRMRYIITNIQPITCLGQLFYHLSIFNTDYNIAGIGRTVDCQMFEPILVWNSLWNFRANSVCKENGDGFFTKRLRFTPLFICPALFPIPFSRPPNAGMHHGIYKLKCIVSSIDSIDRRARPS